jgi:hypothetical protein
LSDIKRWSAPYRKLNRPLAVAGTGGRIELGLLQGFEDAGNWVWICERDFPLEK